MSLNAFIGARHSQKLAPEDLQRRRQVAAGMKVEPGSSQRVSSQINSIALHQSTPPGKQRPPNYPPADPSLFGDSTLGEDSDDTTGGLAGAYGYQDQSVGYSRSQQSFSQGIPPDRVRGLYFNEVVDDDVLGEGGRALNDGNEVLEEAFRDEGDYDNGLESDSEGDHNPRNGPQQSRKARDGQIAVEQFLKIQQNPEISNVWKNQLAGRFSQVRVQPVIAQRGNETIPNRSQGYPNSGVRPMESTSIDTGIPAAEGEIKVTDQDLRGEFEDDEQERVALRYGSNDMQERDDIFDGSELVDSGSGESSHSQHTPRASGKPPNKTASKALKRRPSRVELDHDKDILSKMKYSDLKDQPFDNNPKALPSIVPSELSGPDIPLPNRLRHFAGAGPNSQADFFAQMPMDQWEESGDWFVQQFSDLMSKMQAARRAKRDVSRTFEDELAKREEAVRERSEGIAKVMQQMRTEGQSVLSGKTP